MKIKFKPDLIIWLYLLTSTPVMMIVSFFIFNLILYSEHPQFDIVSYLMLFSMLIISISIYIISAMNYKYSIVFSNKDITIFDKYKGKLNIKYEKISKIEFVKTPMYVWPIFIFTEGNRLIIRYEDENGKEKVFGRKVYTYKVRQLMKSKLIKINYIRLKEADKNLFK